MNPKVFSGFLLNFKDKDLEKGFQEQKQKFQISMLKFFVVFCLTASIVIWIIINPFGLPLSDPFIIIFNTGKVALVIVSILVIKRYKHMVEKLWIAMLLCLAILIFENIKENEDKIQAFGFFYWGLIAQIFFFTTILSRISWKYAVLMILCLKSYIVFRFTNFSLNFEYRFFPLIIAMINQLFLITFGYMNERLDRLRFSEIKAHEKSLQCFKELIKDVIPSSILITHNNKIVFCNEPTKYILHKRVKEVCFSDLSNIAIEINKNENQGANDFEQFNNPFTIQEGDSRVTLQDLMMHPKLKKESPGGNNWASYSGILVDKNFKASSKEIIGSVYLHVKIGKILWEGLNCGIVILMEDPQRLEFYQKRDRYKDKMLATVSHDLRTPLNGIIGMIESLLESPMEKEQRNSLKIAFHSSHHLLSLINDILDFSQINNGKLRLNQVPFNLWKLLKEVRKLIKLQVEHKGLEFIFESRVHDLESLVVVNDPTRLKQILLNLLGNALKFTDSGHIKLEVNVEEVQSYSQEDLNQICYDKVVKISVQDTGCGIKPEHIPKLFKFFGKLETEESQKINQTGIGLGLAISQKIVKRMNCNLKGYLIRVNSVLGEGTTFSFPVLSLGSKSKGDSMRERDDRDIEISLVRPTVTKFRRLGRTASFVPIPRSEIVERKIRVLAVDDDQINLIVVNKYLSQMKEILFDSVNNGKEAFIKFSQKAESNDPYDVVLMDCNMPVMDGFEATKRILAYSSENNIKPPRIIALTANTLLSDHQNCLKSGMVGFISKPFSKKELKEKIATALNE